MRTHARVTVLFVALFILFVALTSMNVSKETWSITAFCLGLFSFAVYIWMLCKHNKHTASSSWIVWVVLDFTSALTMWVEKELNGLIIGYSIGAFITCVVVLRRTGWSTWDRWDRTCIALAAIGIVLWQVFNYLPLELPGLSRPIKGVEVGAFFAQLSGLIGSIPMWRLVWKTPRKENAYCWTMWAWSCACGVMAVTQWTFVKAAAPVCFAFIEWLIIAIIFYRTQIHPPKAT